MGQGARGRVESEAPTERSIGGILGVLEKVAAGDSPETPPKRWVVRRHRRRAPLTGSPEEDLRQFFERSGYVRVPNRERRRELAGRYKKGYEVRLVLADHKELSYVRGLLRVLGFVPAAPFRHAGGCWAQPVYGRAAVQWFSPRSLREKGCEGRPNRDGAA